MKKLLFYETLELELVQVWNYLNKMLSYNQIIKRLLYYNYYFVQKDISQRGNSSGDFTKNSFFKLVNMPLRPLLMWASFVSSLIVVAGFSIK